MAQTLVDVLLHHISPHLLAVGVRLLQPFRFLLFHLSMVYVNPYELVRVVLALFEFHLQKEVSFQFNEKGAAEAYRRRRDTDTGKLVFQVPEAPPPIHPPAHPMRNTRQGQKPTSCEKKCV